MGDETVKVVVRARPFNSQEIKDNRKKDIETGCGKTHTMVGRAEPPELRGIIPNSFEHIFEYIKATAAKEFLVRCSYLEIYNEEIRDLLGSDATAKMELREDPDKGVFVDGLTQIVVDSVAAIDAVQTRGNKFRTVGATAMNAESSRSHSIFTIVIETSEQREGRDCITRGKLNLVDLAGSERASKTQATGSRMKEGIKINLSLTALGNVIAALVDGKSKHVPYRDSKLTRMLQDSLGGNTRTVMIAAVGPADYNYEETLSTLRYANRAKNIKNKPTVNEDPKDALLRQYKDEIESLKGLLMTHLTAAGLAPEAVQGILAQVGGPGDGGKPGAGGKGGKAAGGKAMSALPQAANAAALLAPVAAELRAAEKASADSSAAGGGGSGGEAPANAASAAEGGAAGGAQAAAADGSSSHTALAEARQEAERARADREELAAKLAQLQAMLMHGGAGGSGGGDQQLQAPQPVVVAGIDPATAAAQAEAAAAAATAEAVAAAEVAAAVERREFRKAQLKLKQTRRREAELKAAQSLLADEKAAVEEDLRLLRESVAAPGSEQDKLAKLRDKYQRKVDAVRREMAEAAEEWAGTRESLLAAAREQAREYKLLEQLVGLFLPPVEVGKVWERAVFNEDTEVWTVPRVKPRNGLRPRRLADGSELPVPGAGLTSLSGGGGIVALPVARGAAAGGNGYAEDWEPDERDGAEVVDDYDAGGGGGGSSGGGALASRQGSGGFPAMPLIKGGGGGGGIGESRRRSFVGSSGGTTSSSPLPPVGSSSSGFPSLGGGGGGGASPYQPAAGGGGASAPPSRSARGGPFAPSPVPPGGSGGALPSLGSASPLPPLGGGGGEGAPLPPLGGGGGIPPWAVPAPLAASPAGNGGLPSLGGGGGGGRGGTLGGGHGGGGGNGLPSVMMPSRPPGVRGAPPAGGGGGRPMAGGGDAGGDGFPSLGGGGSVGGGLPSLGGKGGFGGGGGGAINPKRGSGGGLPSI